MTKQKLILQRPAQTGLARVPNIMERHKVVQDIVADVYSRIGKESITENQKKTLIRETTNICMTVMARMMLSDFGKLAKKETRIENFYNLFVDHYQELCDELIDDTKQPSFEQLNAENALKVATGIDFLKGYRKAKVV